MSEVNARLSSRTISIVSLDFNASSSAVPTGIMRNEHTLFTDVFHGISNLFAWPFVNPDLQLGVDPAPQCRRPLEKEHDRRQHV